MKNKKRQVLTIPASDELKEKLEKIAEANGLSLTDVTKLCIASGIQMVQTKLGEIHGSPQKKAA